MSIINIGSKRTDINDENKAARNRRLYRKLQPNPLNSSSDDDSQSGGGQSDSDSGSGSDSGTRFRTGRYWADRAGRQVSDSEESLSGGGSLSGGSSSTSSAPRFQVPYDMEHNGVITTARQRVKVLFDNGRWYTGTLSSGPGPKRTLRYDDGDFETIDAEAEHARGELVVIDQQPAMSLRSGSSTMSAPVSTMSGPGSTTSSLRPLDMVFQEPYNIDHNRYLPGRRDSQLSDVASDQSDRFARADAQDAMRRQRHRDVFQFVDDQAPSDDGEASGSESINQYEPFMMRNLSVN